MSKLVDNACLWQRKNWISLFSFPYFRVVPLKDNKGYRKCRQMLSVQTKDKHFWPASNWAPPQTTEVLRSRLDEFLAPRQEERKEQKIWMKFCFLSGTSKSQKYEAYESGWEKCQAKSCLDAKSNSHSIVCTHLQGKRTTFQATGKTVWCFTFASVLVQSHCPTRPCPTKRHKIKFHGSQRQKGLNSGAGNIAEIETECVRSVCSVYVCVCVCDVNPTPTTWINYGNWHQTESERWDNASTHPVCLCYSRRNRTQCGVTLTDWQGNLHPDNPPPDFHFSSGAQVNGLSRNAIVQC